MGLSKTDEYCTCGSLQRAAEDVGVPVKYDKDMNEFHLLHGPEGRGRLIIRHCFFCGGKAPESLRANLFTRLSDQERNRLTDLIRPLQTVQAIIAAWGEPDDDREAGESVTYPERDGKPGETRVYRTLLYRGLSETANVHVTVYPEGRIGYSFRGKFIGKTPEQSEV